MTIAGAAYIILIALVLVDIITKDQSQIRNLPKVTWVIMVIFLPLIGTIVWFVAGRSYPETREHVSFGDPRRAEAAMSSRSVEDEMANLDAEIAFHEREARIRRLEAELEAKRKRESGEG
jgi:hypothetical protein